MATDPQAKLTGFKEEISTKVVDVNNPTTHEYRYDANGNLWADYNKGIEKIEYNYLNLPRMVDLGKNNQIEYLYDAAGIKLQQRVYKEGNLDKVTDYIGNFIYENGSLAFILTDDGRLVPKEGGGYDQEYYIKDHLGNNRVVMTDTNNDGIPEVMQENHYYPFGMALGGQSYQNPLQKAVNKYLYNGKELQDDLGLEWYDYGARFYDAQIGRWHCIDLAAELYYIFSPYNYTMSDPINLIDPNGMWVRGPDAWNSLNEQLDEIDEKERNEREQEQNQSNTDPPKKAKKPGKSKEMKPSRRKAWVEATKSNKENLSEVSWGETSGVYPTKNMNPSNAELFDPKKWDNEKTKQLLKARSAINFIYKNRNHRAHPDDVNMNDPIENILASFHLTDNFPDVDPIIKNDESVTHFYVDPSPTPVHTGVTEEWNQRIVISYGPFYNIGGGDGRNSKAGPVYIIFYSVFK